jgi:hypothetical protein
LRAVLRVGRPDDYEGSSLVVMRNRNDGSDAAEWWNELPPRIRNRVAEPFAPPGRGGHPDPERPDGPGAGKFPSELSTLALAAMFALVGLGLMLYLLLAVTFVTG